MEIAVVVAEQSVKINVEVNDSGCKDLCQKLSKVAKGIPEQYHRYLAQSYAFFIFQWADWMKHNGCVQGWEFGQLCTVLQRYDFRDDATMVEVCTYIKTRYIEFIEAAKPIAEKFKEDFDFLPQYLRIHSSFNTVAVMTAGYANK